MRAFSTLAPPMLKDAPDHHDADLLLKVYDLRRDSVLRESRTAINTNFWPRTLEEFLAVTKRDHPLNAALRQTSSYWEMVYGMVRHGIVHAEYFLESNGEGLYLFARVAPYLAEYRRVSDPRAFQNAEWVATHSDAGRSHMARFTARIAETLASR
jgi:hypothetical protein